MWVADTIFDQDRHHHWSPTHRDLLTGELLPRRPEQVQGRQAAYFRYTHYGTQETEIKKHYSILEKS